MGSLERLKEEKGELFQKMRKDGTILVNQDDPRVVDLARDYPGQKITFGIETPAEVMAKEIQLRGIEGTSFTLILEEEAMEVHLRLLGRHFVPNALSAIAVACLFGVEVKQAKEAIEHFQSFPMRMEVVPLKGGKTLINDAYNANPYSMELALETLAEVKGKGRAIAVVGDMLELGNFAKEAHEQLGEKVSRLAIDLLLVLGEEAPLVVESAIRHGFPIERTRVVESHSEAISLLRQMVQNGDWILVKGSRRMAMEKIIEGLREGRT
jgi:UDP-N-acetylmuramoyl-tripeptide--D-alanyl-D-alanine ligase